MLGLFVIINLSILGIFTVAMIGYHVYNSKQIKQRNKGIDE